MKRIISLLVFGVFLIAEVPSVLGYSWSGYVLDNNTIGINLANVSAVLNVSGNYTDSTLTDADGFFNVSIPFLTSVRLITSKTGYQNDTSSGLPPIGGDFVLPFNITLLLDLRGNLSGRVTDHVGNGIVNATVEAIQGDIIKGLDITNINGDYLIANLRDGTYTVKITKDNITQNITNVVVLPGSATDVNFSVILDVDAPVISNVETILITSSGAVITWQTNEPANSSVYYYRTNSSAVLNSSFSTLTTSHLVVLTSLSSNTLYYYNVSSCDFSGNCNTSMQYNFTTPSPGSDGGNGGGNGGGGGCITEWSCRGLAECVAGNQTRTCIKEKSYCYVGKKPDETQACKISISPEEEEIPRQLFDIKLELDDSLIQSSDELVARVIFTNFGTEPTPVSLTFIILNEAGNEIYREKGSITVITEEVVSKRFKELGLPHGRYTLVLHTLYNADVFDEFRQGFEIAGERVTNLWRRNFFGVVAVILAVIGASYMLTKPKMHGKTTKLRLRKTRNLLEWIPWTKKTIRNIRVLRRHGR